MQNMVVFFWNRATLFFSILIFVFGCLLPLHSSEATAAFEEPTTSFSSSSSPFQTTVSRLTDKSLSTSVGQPLFIRDDSEKVRQLPDYLQSLAVPETLGTPPPPPTMSQQNSLPRLSSGGHFQPKTETERKQNKKKTAPLKPIIMIPGICGSGLFASLRDALIPSCSSSPQNVTTAYRMWASLLQLYPTHQQCWADTLSLRYDSAEDLYFSREGVHIVPDGEAESSVAGFDYLDYAWERAHHVGCSACNNSTHRQVTERHKKTDSSFDRQPLQRHFFSREVNNERASSWTVGLRRGVTAIKEPGEAMAHSHEDDQQLAQSPPTGAKSFRVDHLLEGERRPGSICDTANSTVVGSRSYLPLTRRVGVPGTQYFHGMIEAFKSVGYEEGLNLAGRPYDWRLPLWQIMETNTNPSQIREASETEEDIVPIAQRSDWTNRTIAAVEDLYHRNGGQKVVFIAHSLGTLTTVYFLNRIVSQSWKDTYVDSFVSVGGVYGGSFKVVKAILSGYNDPVNLDIWNVVNVSLVPAALLRSMHRTMGSMYSLAPTPQIFGKDYIIAVVFEPSSPTSDLGVWSRWTHWWKSLWTSVSHTARKWLADGHGVSFFNNYTLLTEFRAGFWPFSSDVTTPQNTSQPSDLTPANNGSYQVYGLTNWTHLLPQEYTIMLQKAVQHMANHSTADPGVPVFCLWSNFDVPSTDYGYVYPDGNIDHPPQIKYGFGDGTVPLESLKHCTTWASTAFAHEFPNLDHMLIFNDASFNRMLVSLVTGRIPALKQRPQAVGCASNRRRVERRSREVTVVTDGATNATAPSESPRLSEPQAFTQ